MRKHGFVVISFAWAHCGKVSQIVRETTPRFDVGAFRGYHLTSSVTGAILQVKGGLTLVVSTSTSSLPFFVFIFFLLVRVRDYVTEKVYNGLQSGTLPVYWGAENVEDFVPKGSVVKVSNMTDAANSR